jgi:hypothetical protein
MPTNVEQQARDGTLATNTSGAGTTHRRLEFLHDRSPSSLARAIPFAIAAAYFVVLAVRYAQLVESFTWDSDVSSGFAIAETLAHAGDGGHTVMTSMGAYVSLWFGLLTASLPLHRALWENAGTVVFIAAALTIGWSVRQVASRRAAVLATLLALVVTPAAFFVLTAGYSHNPAYLGTALLGAYVVWMMRARPLRRVTAVSVALLAGVVVGVFWASDLLLVVTGIVPFAFTAVLGAMQRSRRSRMFALSALTTLATAVAVALFTSMTMGSLGFVVVHPTTSTLPLSAIPLHAEYLFEGLKNIFGGYLGGPLAPGTLESVVGSAAIVVTLAAMLMLLVMGAYSVARLAMSTLRRGRVQTAPHDLATALHIVYWTGSAASTAVAFELSAQVTHASNEYYVTLIFSVAAIAPLLMRAVSFGRWLVPAGASILFIASLLALTSYVVYPPPLAQKGVAQDASAIIGLAEANHATVGYAGYWWTSDLTWNAHERIQVRPVSLCENPAGADLCPFYIARVPSWYEPAQRRSFLLVNPSEYYVYGLPKGLGPPLASYALGSSTRMYVYPYDIASRLGPAPD